MLTLSGALWKLLGIDISDLGGGSQQEGEEQWTLSDGTNATCRYLSWYKARRGTAHPKNLESQVPRSSTPKLLGPHSASISQPNENFEREEETKNQHFPARQELLAPAHRVPPTNWWMFNISSSISPTKELQPRSRFFSCIQQERLHKTGLADVCFF